MEADLSLLGQIKKEFQCKEVDVRAYSPLTLAYIGDAVYEVIIRTIIVERANKAANELHKKAVKFVQAGTQADMVTALQDILTEDEIAVFKRGRNAKSNTAAKNASITDYRKATGFEALIGFLYLMDDMNRVLFLVKEGIERVGLNI